MNDYNDVINKFLAQSYLHLASDAEHSYSRHIDELGVLSGTSTHDQIDIALELFGILVKAYAPHSRQFMAMLVIALNESNSQEVISLQEVINMQEPLTQPPELYIVNRSPQLSPYIVEEHKYPLSPDLKLQNDDEIYSYFKSFRNASDEPLEHAIFFEHYPEKTTAFKSFAQLDITDFVS